MCRINKYNSIILVLVLLLTSTTLFADETTNFIHLQAKNNGQQTNATNVVEDSKGYLFIESYVGLLKYDGYDFKLIPQSKIFSQKAYSSSLLKLLKQKDQTIWAISRKGDISKLLPSGKFQEYASVISNPNEDFQFESTNISDTIIWMGSNNGLVIGQSTRTKKIIKFDTQSNENITSISQDNRNTIWFGTSKGRIFKGNIRTKDLQEIKGPFNNPFNTIVLSTDNYNNLWIGTELHGLFHYDTKTNKYEDYKEKGLKLNFVPSNMIIRVFKDSNGLIWMGTDGGGLYKIDPKTKQVKRYTQQKTNPFSLQSKTVIGIGETNNKDIWVFTNYGNINIIPNESNTVGYHCGSIDGSPTRILSVLKAKNGNLWLGTDGEGLSRINANGNATHQYIANTSSSRGIPGNYIQAIAEDKNGNLWIGTYLNGLAFFNKNTNKFTRIKTANQYGQVGTDIRSIYIDKKNRIWTGSNIGIFVFNDKQQQIAYFQYNNQDLQGSIAEFFIEDEIGQFWIGMFNGGICLMDESTNLQNSRFITYKLSPSNNITESSVLHGVSDQCGFLYLINGYSKLVTFDIHKKEVVPIKGFSNDQIHGCLAIISSDKHNIWLSKNNGISHLDLQSNEEYFYTWKNGIIKGKFLTGSAFKDPEGIIYFGGIEGVNYFNPNDMQTQKKDLNLYINHLEIVNRNAEEIIPEQVVNGIEQTKKLQFNYKQTSFSFQFSVIDDHLGPNYTYAYRLKGFNDNWITTSENRVATYTNIPYGDYTFEVKAGTKPNDWNISAKSIDIEILPPLWKRWWAYTIYFLLLFVISFFIIRYYIMWVKLKQKLLVEELQNEKNKELYAMKMNFFAKMSHEIQTPLTLILSPIDNMIERAEGNLLLSQRLQVIKNNATRLSRIAMELMTIRNKEMGKLTIRASEDNVVNHLNKVALSFMEQARFKHIDLILECESKKIMLWYDHHKLEHIIYNLLANAFKFTPRDGKITLEIKEDIDSNKVYIKVTDTGIGIPKHDLENIFNLFYQSQDGKSVGGTGIGLALTKELILLHKGEIKVESEINKGTIFTIALPMGNKHFTKEEIIIQDIVQTKVEEAKSITEPKEEQLEPSIDENKRNLLIVEDNFEMLMFLEDSFKAHYNVITAQNGQEALDKATSLKTDIILSDVMMPIMDGVTLCKLLKEKRSTRHIPIILLTTKNATASKLEGLQFGAIEYLNKPFNIKELLLKVNNILEAQQRLIEQYRAEILTESKEIEVKSPDEKFIESVIMEMERNFDNPDFRLEDLAEPLNMSYSNIYRKFQALTDKTLVDFMRSFRLKKAIPLLVKHNFTISEIAFQIGFNDPKYFSKCFKKEYGVTPKQYKQQNNSTTDNIIEN
ncbi:hybrid sensor histidine kinase/response regulator transcription factor [Marinifilum fragile]|uniref:hybrid sensor histidine kinase/response regulator transcription factor n=1 Tax=Marinifilum fragile TaxID=570161 RepID=UPI0006D0917E|nr:hybrid sensor histidine kinase/response regulator transcription factor [Marinifilum fragile]